MSTVLYYFRGRGRAEPIRILLNYLQIAYQDKFIESAEAMTEFRAQALTPFGQLPVLFIDDHYLAQSQAIYRYLARAHALYGVDDQQAYYCDQIAAGLQDWQTQYFAAIFNAAKTEAYLKERIIRYYQLYESLLNIHDGLYFLGEQISFVDLLLFELLLNQEDFCDSHSIEDYPHLLALMQRLKAHQSLADYLASDRRQAFPSKENAYVERIDKILRP